jgi:toxin-antitoxin system PIN domain toxin
LLDINVLIALLDPNHPDNGSASDWFDLNYVDGWLTCPLTQNGCVRVLSQPQYPRALRVALAIGRLRAATSTPYHQFISDDISILDEALVDHRHLAGYRQLTDVYLLALAVSNDARLIILDSRIPLGAVNGATEQQLVVL